MGRLLRDGRIELGGGLTLDGGLTETTLLAATAGLARPLVHNGIYRSYLLPKTALNGRDFRPSVYFTDGRIVSVHLTWADPETDGGSAWESHSFDRERSIAEADATWLAATLDGVGSTTATYTFEWGTIWSGFDDRGGFSSIVVRYGQP
jgi:hypothetical protein